ncbi:Mor family transcriptional regulator [Actinoplanes campanulatus]|uniref:Mor family transcriptional regulator n=1 Tax=Actinoplanes campanulatus TaxID=113559 RepID=A0A7W5ASD5_9ACTN|nr:hypothetical protein [Actinoplanes campanulatus]MBB3101129.1 Mor family transcriptional regulator [Actinoplanes campanulatus]GGN51600.1 hypothetical protein GCM10010109_91850 [Actinoplanes campanulatus]GID42573.1 hypothetical protein Aca09nite_90790 [Actinoplanes campanulatus]
MTDSRDDRIVAEFGEGHAVEDIAARYGLTVAQVYMVVEREVRFDPAPASPYYAPPAPSYPDVDTIVAEYGAGYDIQWIAHKHHLSVDWIYYLIHQAVR